MCLYVQYDRILRLLLKMHCLHLCHIYLVHKTAVTSVIDSCRLPSHCTFTASFYLWRKLMPTSNWKTSLAGKRQQLYLSTDRLEDNCTVYK